MACKAMILAAVTFMLTFRPAAATATYHLMKIVEVFAGTADNPAAQYITLQMYFPGQNFVGGHQVTVYDASGVLVGTFTFSGSVTNGANLATILIATADAVTLFGVSADLAMSPAISATGGAVCWDVVDCVAWGSFVAAGALPAPPGTPFNASGGLIPDMAMHRTLSSGGAVSDFVFAAPAPKNNAGQTGTLPATPTVPVGASPTATPTAEATPPAVCAGDCDGSGEVAINEIILLVSIALGNAEATTCALGIPSGEQVTIALIVSAVNAALSGCEQTLEEHGCGASGGTVSTGLCCASAPDFPDGCAIGACGCSPASSRVVSICVCGVGACFDRTQRACVPR